MKPRYDSGRSAYISPKLRPQDARCAKALSAFIGTYLSRYHRRACETFETVPRRVDLLTLKDSGASGVGGAVNYALSANSRYW